MASYKIEEVEGIGPVIGSKFRTVGVTTTDTLLKNCQTKKQRHDLADKVGISEQQVLKFANMVDLFRINGVGQEFAELLEAAGIDTVPELAQRKPENLVSKMVEVNEVKHLTRRTPSIKDVEKWVTEAKTLPRVLEY